MKKPYSLHHLSHARQHAIVIGGGIAGLLAARVLTNHLQIISLMSMKIMIRVLDGAVLDVNSRMMIILAHLPFHQKPLPSYSCAHKNTIFQ